MTSDRWARARRACLNRQCRQHRPEKLFHRYALACGDCGLEIPADDIRRLWGMPMDDDEEWKRAYFYARRVRWKLYGGKPID